MKHKCTFSSVFALSLLSASFFSAPSTEAAGRDWFWEMSEAIRHNDVSTARYLLEQGYPIETADWQGYTGLMVAAYSGQVEIAKMLLTAGADVNYSNYSSDNDREYRTTALIEAARSCQAKMASLLIRAGAKANIPVLDRSFDPPIFEVMGCRSLETARILVREGHANIELRDSWGRTPLVVASGRMPDFEFASFLIAQGAKLDTVDHHGATALMWAVVNHNNDIVHLLVSKGANRSIRDRDGKTAYDYAVEIRDVELMSLLKP